MGYAVLLSSDDQALRQAIGNDPQEAARLLGRLLQEAHAGKASHAGPWQVAGTVHSSTAACLALDEDGLALLDAARDVPAATAAWIPAQQRPALPWTPQAQLAGLAQQRRLTIRSAWWAYADSLPWALDGEEAMQVGLCIGQALQATGLASVPAGYHANSLNRAGGIPGPGTCPVYWSGNRLCGTDGLLPWEREILLR